MAYDPKLLLEKMRKHGGPDAEKLAKANFAAVCEWLVESAAGSENKIDDVAVPLAVATLSPVVVKALDAIDGQVG
jgi:hypothetical protein